MDNHSFHLVVIHRVLDGYGPATLVIYWDFLHCWCDGRWSSSLWAGGQGHLNNHVFAKAKEEDQFPWVDFMELFFTLTDYVTEEILCDYTHIWGHFYGRS